MASFPTLSACMSGPTRYPFTRTLYCPSAVRVFEGGKEQRWKAAPAYYVFELNLLDLTAADRDAVTTFFNTQKGQFGQTWDIEILGTTYNACSFEQDELMWTEDTPMRYSARLKLRGYL